MCHGRAKDAEDKLQKQRESYEAIIKRQDEDVKQADQYTEDFMQKARDVQMEFDNTRSKLVEQARLRVVVFFLSSFYSFFLISHHFSFHFFSFKLTKNLYNRHISRNKNRNKNSRIKLQIRRF